ncbi:MAG: hypothetical protein ACM3VS_01125 [Candidatus Dadabacteria bacterium]
MRDDNTYKDCQLCAEARKNCDWGPGMWATPRLKKTGTLQAQSLLHNEG